MTAAAVCAYKQLRCKRIASILCIHIYYKITVNPSERRTDMATLRISHIDSLWLGLQLVDVIIIIMLSLSKSTKAYIVKRSLDEIITRAVATPFDHNIVIIITHFIIYVHFTFYMFHQKNRLVYGATERDHTRLQTITEIQISTR
jgi:hypothetical protein